MSSRSLVIPTHFTAVDRFSSPVMRMGGSVEKFAIQARASLAFAERGFRRLMAPISALNRMMQGAGFYVGLYSFIHAIRGAIRTIADFQDAQINISTVTGKSVAENKALSNQARSMAIRYGMAAESVSNLQYELIKMGLAERKGGMDNVIAATPAITLGAKAMNAPVDELSKIVGSGMQLFDKTPQQLVDLYAVGLDKSALDFESFSTMIRNSQQAWSLTKKPVEELVALLAIASNAFVHTASAGTGIKNMTIDNAIATKELSDQMDKIINSKNPLETIYKMYGRKTFQVASPISEAFANGDFRKFTDMFNDPKQINGYTNKIAEIRMLSINSIWNKVKTSWQELILSIDEGSGKISAALSNVGKITSAMFLLASGSEMAQEQLTRMDSSIVIMAQSWLTILDRLWTFIKLIIYIKALLLAYRAIMFVVAIVQGAFSVALGISAFVGKQNILAIRGNAIAMGSLRAMTILTTPSLWAMNAAMYASPLIILALGIAAVVGGMALMNNWADGLTGGFLGMSSAVDQYSKSLNNVPDMYSSDWWAKKQKEIEFSMLPDHIQRQQMNPVYKNKGYMSMSDRYNQEEENSTQIASVPKSQFDSNGLNGALTININDPSGAVNNVEKQGSFRDAIKVKTSSTMQGFGSPVENTY